MTPDVFYAYAEQFDEVFFLIGGAMLVIELLKGIFTRSLSGKGVLDMIASVSTQIPYLIVEVFLMSMVYLGFVLVSDAWISWQFEPTLTIALVTMLAADFVYYWEHRFAHEVRLLWT